MIRYWEFLRIAFLNILAFRARYYVGILTYLIHVSVYYFIWKAIFAFQHEEVGGYRFEEMVSYICLAWIGKSFYFNYLDNHIVQRIREGGLAMDLIKPVDFQMMMLATTLGESLFRFVLFTIPIGVVVYLAFGILPPASVHAAGLFILSTMLSFIVYSSLNFIIGLMGLYLENLEMTLFAKNQLIELLSGVLVPLSFFPSWLGTVLQALPFAAIAYVPLQIYLGKVTGGEAVQSLAFQAAWAFGLLAAGRLLWWASARRLMIQGG